MNKNLMPYLSNKELRELSKLEAQAKNIDKEINESSKERHRVMKPKYRRGKKPGRALTTDEQFACLVLTQHLENLKNDRKGLTHAMNILRNRAAKRRQQGWGG